MIKLADVAKFYDTRHGRVRIFDHVNLDIAPGEKVGILGRNGAGKSTMIRLISGGAFQNALTGLDNLRCICRIYGKSPEDKVAFVEDFSELGSYLREPVRTYSAGMRARLAFALSMVVEFDCFLIDEIVAVGDARFTEKCRVELFEKRGDRAMIIVSHDPTYIREHCDRASALVDGTLHHFGDLDAAFSFYNAAMAGPAEAA